MRVGLWENGKRSTWLDEQQVSKINNKDFSSEMATIFKDPASVEALPSDSGLDKPDGWQEGMNKITDTLNVPLAKI